MGVHKEEHWQVKRVSYHDKKKNNLWITVSIEDLNNYIEEYEHNNYILCHVLFSNGSPEIKNCIPNSRGLKSAELTNEQKEMVLLAAIEKSKEYLN